MRAAFFMAFLMAVLIKFSCESNQTSGNHLVIVMENWQPYVGSVDGPGGIESIAGPMQKFLEIFARKRNFTYSLIHSPERVWGAPDETGRWSGMMGLLHRNEVDMGLGPFVVSLPREEAVDFSVPFLIDQFGIVFERPAQSFDFWNFTNSFGYIVYCCIVVCCALIFVSYYWVSRKEDGIFGRSGSPSLYDSLLLTIKPLFQETIRKLPVSLAARLIAVSWLMICLVLTRGYEGTLTAILAAPKVNIPIDSLDDLVTQTDYTWKLEKDALIYHYFREQTEGIGKEVYEKKNGTHKQCWVDRDRIRGGEFASICQVVSILKMMDWDFSTHGRCGLYLANKVVIGGMMISTAFPTNSSLKPHADVLIQSIIEAGLFRKWLGDVMLNSTQCLQHPSSDPRQSLTLPLDMFYGHFSLLTFGILISVATFAGEMLFGRPKNREKLLVP